MLEEFVLLFEVQCINFPAACCLLLPIIWAETDRVNCLFRPDRRDWERGELMLTLRLNVYFPDDCETEINYEGYCLQVVIAIFLDLKDD